MPVGEESGTTVIGGGLHKMYREFGKIMLSDGNVMQNCQREGKNQRIVFGCDNWKRTMFVKSHCLYCLLSSGRLSSRFPLHSGIHRQRKHVITKGFSALYSYMCLPLQKIC